MDEAKHAYRCLPLTMANTAGWELQNPIGFEAEWDGGPSVECLDVSFDDDAHAEYVKSHFGFGILTIHPGWLFTTPPGFNILAQGSPNFIKDGIQPLTGLVETDWLPFSFTMNWRFSRPGRVRFEAGEPLCFISILQPALMASAQPVERSLDENPELKSEYEAWSRSRREFNHGLRDGDPEIRAAGWQRNYHRGITPTGAPAPQTHASKRRMRPLLELATAPKAPADPPRTPLPFPGLYDANFQLLRDDA